MAGQTSSHGNFDGWNEIEFQLYDHRKRNEQKNLLCRVTLDRLGYNFR